MTKHYYAIRVGDPVNGTTRVEKADGPREACRAAYGTIYDRWDAESPSEWVRYKDLGSSKPSSFPKALAGPESDWKPIPPPPGIEDALFGIHKCEVPGGFNNLNHFLGSLVGVKRAVRSDDGKTVRIRFDSTKQPAHIVPAFVQDQSGGLVILSYHPGGEKDPSLLETGGNPSRGAPRVVDEPSSPLNLGNPVPVNSHVMDRDPHSAFHRGANAADEPSGDDERDARMSRNEKLYLESFGPSDPRPVVLLDRLIDAAHQLGSCKMVVDSCLACRHTFGGEKDLAEWKAKYEQRREAFLKAFEEVAGVTVAR